MRNISYYLDFFSMPLLAGLLTALSPPGGVAWVALVAAGYLAWVLAEYVIHRFLFHRMFRRQHWLHHLRPASADGAVSTVASHGTFVAAQVVLTALLGLAHGSALMVGLTLGYWLYAVLHHGIHRRWFSPFGVLGGLVRRHDLHHSGAEVNFNFLCPLGDRLFGTYKRVSISTFQRRGE